MRRDNRFSPNSVEHDRLILMAACKRVKALTGLKTDIPMIDESEFVQRPVDAECILTMARSKQTLKALVRLEQSGRHVINATTGVKNCQRSVLDKLMRTNNVPMPPTKEGHGYWLKRGDAAAQSKADVVYCEDKAALLDAENDFRSRGISDMVVSAHVPGDLIKFYAVGSTMFQYYYPSDDGISKFGDELRNGRAHHYAFDSAALHREVTRLAEITGVSVYGGDAVVGKDGRFYIIDFNDWPSFSRCRDEAAEAIAQLAVASIASKSYNVGEK